MKQINVFCGRFQPFHLGHLKCCEDAYKLNGLSTFIFYIPNKQFDNRKPFSDELLEREYQILVNNYNFIEGFDWMMNPQPVRMCRVLKEKGYESILWLCGEDRLDNYQKLLNQNSKDKIKNELQVNIPEIYLTNRYLSATEVRNYIIEDNINEYNKSMPNGTDILYNDFRTEILKR